MEPGRERSSKARSWRRNARLERHGTAAAFWLCALLGAGLGLDAVTAGAQTVFDQIDATGLMAARADDARGAAVVLALDSAPRMREPVLRRPPRVLMPVSAVAAPIWLADARFAADASGVRRKHQPPVAIVIDDLGPDSARAREAIALPPGVSLAFLPAPAATPALARAAHRAGHEVLLHMPMEPDGNVDPGPMALMLGLDAGEIERRVDWALTRVPGAVGVNNHMGSRFTMSVADLLPVMKVLRHRALYFLDSRTTPVTRAAAIAGGIGVLSGERDVFLDNEAGEQAVKNALARLVEIAQAKGSAVAIGHPQPATFAALKAWLAQMRGHGVRLAPVSEVLRVRRHIEGTRSKSLSVVSADG